MIKSAAMALIGAMAFTTASHIQVPEQPFPADTYVMQPAGIDPSDKAIETLAVYYSPLPATRLAKYAGFEMAYHMAVVYTAHTGLSYGVTAIPSDMTAAQTSRNMFEAILDMANDQPSSFGTLFADRSNNKAFVKGRQGDFYTKDPQGQPYRHSLVMRARNLSGQWASIVRTYERISSLNLTYSPMSQNSNSLAATALRRAGIGLDFSSNTVFTPGAFTQLPF